MNKGLLQGIGVLHRGAQVLRHAPGLRSCEGLWTMIRAPYRRLLQGATQDSGMPIRIAGHQILVDSSFSSKRWDQIEVQTYRAYAAAAEKAEVIYDVGAHIGTYTMLALKASPGLRAVVAYEPHDFTRSLLLRHLQWNRCGERVMVRTQCCGARMTEALFYGDPGKAEGDNGLVPARGAPQRTVQVVTLDHEVTELGLAPSLIKIDVEGAEMDVLRGGEQAIQRYSPVLFLSIHEEPLAQQGMSSRTVFDWLAEHGYRWEIIEKDHEIHAVATRDRPVEPS